jgi:hypothetical protein
LEASSRNFLKWPLLINSSIRSLSLKHFSVSCPLHLWYVHHAFRSLLECDPYPC